MKVAVIGECMLELSPAGGSQFSLKFGGDVMNTAVHLARAGIDTGFFSAIGDGHYSDWLLDAWQTENIQCSGVQRLTGKEPSLYLIRNDSEGERHFHYWRSDSPFGDWLTDREYLARLPAMLAEYDHLHYSGVTLAMLPIDDRQQLIRLLEDYRDRGGSVSFDPNYRPRLWPSRTEAIDWLDRGYTTADIVLPSLEDEQLLRQPDSLEHLLQLLARAAPGESILKAGADGCWILQAEASRQIPCTPGIQAIDTTGAGDAFNAGYLLGRLSGADQEAAAKAGHAMAAATVQHQGAILPRD